MNEPTTDNLVKRIERLERENRWLKRLQTVVIVGITAVMMMGQATPSEVAKVIEADRFVLRDASGKVRAMLGVEEGDTTSLQFYDKNGDNGVGLVQDPSGRELFRLAHNNKTRMTLAVTGDVSGLSLFDADEKIKVILCECGADSGLSFYYDKKPRSIFGNNQAGSLLKMFDKDGKVIWQAPR